MKKRLPGILIGVIISAVALAYLLRRDLSGVRDELAGAHYWAVIPCFALSIVGLWLRSLRWRVLLDYRLSPTHSFHILNVSYLINGVLPLRVGELVRAVLAARVDPPVRILTSLSTVLVERLLDVLAVLVLLGLVLILLPVRLEIGVMGAALGVGSVVGVVALAVFAARPTWAHYLLEKGGRVVPLLRRSQMHNWLDHLLDGIKPLASARATLLLAGWTAVSWFFSVAAGYVLLYAIFDHPTWAASMAMVALAAFVIAVPAVPGSLGPFEAAVAFGLAGAGLVEEASDAPSVAFALLVHVVNLLTYVSMGLIGLWAEDVGLGEVTRAARQLRERDHGSAEPVELGPTAPVRLKD